MRGQDREQVVEILRCAADVVGEKLHRGPIASASDFLDCTLGDAERDAYRACGALGGACANPDEYRHRLLEAAQRVAEGTGP